jgi:hypothetical protein
VAGAVAPKPIDEVERLQAELARVLRQFAAEEGRALAI